MRDTTALSWFGQSLSDASVHALRIGAVALAIGFVMAAGPVRAQDDDDDDGKTFEEKIIDGVMAGIGATNMDNRGIDYRERSPLVVPPKLDLPPPANAATEVTAPNWPKDPDVARRKAAIARRKKDTRDATTVMNEAARPLSPSELNVGRTAAPVRTSNEPLQPGVSNSPMLSPSQLGFNGSISSFFHGNTTESAPFKGEPTRESLTQPPTGYQTPSPNFAYGTGPMQPLSKGYSPSEDIMSPKYGSSQ